MFAVMDASAAFAHSLSHSVGRSLHVEPKACTKTLAVAREIDFVSVSQKAPSGRFMRRPLNINSHNHNQRDRRRRFYLAVQFERSKSTPRYDILLLRNRAPPSGGPAIPPHADCSTLRRSTAAEPSCARCKTCARPAIRMTMGRHYVCRLPHDLLTHAQVSLSRL